MEPLIATDWLKDYDPLFDLFDEEMRAGGQVASAAAMSDYFNEYDMNNNYYSKQVDELSLILGLEWMPNLELHSPVAPSTGSSSAPSPASTFSSTGSTTSSSSSTGSTGCSLNSFPSTSASSQAVNPLVPSTILPHQSSSCSSVSAYSGSPSSSVSNSQHQLVSGFIKHHPKQQPPTTSATKVKQPKLELTHTENQLVGVPTSALKKRKKCLKTKGTSLLAQPSPKLLTTTTTNHSSPSPVSFTPLIAATTSTTTSTTNTALRTPIATPLLTITINNNNHKGSKLSSSSSSAAAASLSSASAATTSLPVASLSQQVLPITLTAATTTLSATTTNLPHTISVQHAHQLAPTPTTSTHHHNYHHHRQRQQNYQPTKLDQVARYCSEIEHAYSLSH